MLDSVCRSAGDYKDYEFVVRMHRDDGDAISAIPGLLYQYPNLRIIIGENLKGFESLGTFFQECSAIAQGHFVWMVSDDEIIEGPWFEMLSQAPKRAFIKPENYTLNLSKYNHCADCGTLIVPRECWKEYAVTQLPPIVDLALYELLVKNNGWTLHYLKGVTGIHYRRVDRTLAKERY